MLLEHEIAIEHAIPLPPVQDVPPIPRRLDAQIAQLPRRQREELLPRLELWRVLDRVATDLLEELGHVRCPRGFRRYVWWREGVVEVAAGEEGGEVERCGEAAGGKHFFFFFRAVRGKERKKSVIC